MIMRARRQQPRIRTLCTAVIVDGGRWSRRRGEIEIFRRPRELFPYRRLFTQHTGIVRTKGHLDDRSSWSWFHWIIAASVLQRNWLMSCNSLHDYSVSSTRTHDRGKAYELRCGRKLNWDWTWTSLVSWLPFLCRYRETDRRTEWVRLCC